jgi:hypothetical protein
LPWFPPIGAIWEVRRKFAQIGGKFPKEVFPDATGILLVQKTTIILLRNFDARIHSASRRAWVVGSGPERLVLSLT